MKRKFNIKKRVSNYRKLKIGFLLVIIILIYSPNIYSQRLTNEKISEIMINSVINIQNLPNAILNDMPEEINGRLKFRDNDHFSSFRKELEAFGTKENALGNRSLYYVNVGDINTLEPDGALAAFEKNYPNFESARKKFAIQESLDLLNGKEIGEIDNPPYSLNDITNSLMNSEYEIQIGETIVSSYGDVTFYVNNETSFNLLKRTRGDGYTNPWDIDTSIVIREEKRIIKEDDCDAVADFSSSGYDRKYNFTFKGTPNPNNTALKVDFRWTFGDGGTSKERNPSYNYQKDGTFQVCLYIEAYDKEKGIFCNDSKCIDIDVKRSVDTEDCEWFEALKAVFVWNETGTPGEICFTGVGDMFSQIHDQDLNVSWHWNFGDNTQSDEKFPCHIYPCDKNYPVTLDVVTESGCRHTFTMSITVNSYKCCDEDAGLSSEGYYDQDDRKYKFNYSQHLNAVWPYWWSQEYEVDSKLKHYRWNKFWGYWARNDTKLAIQITGNGYSPTPAGCKCENEEDISKSVNVSDHWKVRAHKTFSGRVQTRYQFDWNTKYYIKSVLKADENTSAICD